ncbi:MAG: hypothetical protein KJ749_11220 [Planctomycetes bacterium]|nr:hypothetical protein [Planctomycetota bacterium]
MPILIVCAVIPGFGVGAGCTSISIEPTCPEELAVGASGEVRANEQNPGGIATYSWEVFPAGSGAFTDPTLPATTFEAAEVGDVVIRLTASDGLYQVISSCTTRIVEGAAVAVALQADPTEAEVGDTITLTCTSTGSSIALGITIAQTEGPDGQFTEVSVGTSEFIPAQAGDFTFECVGVDINSVRSEPALVSLSVTESSTSDGGGRR